jgi:hypothetical protein
MISVTLPGASRLKALLQQRGNARQAIEARAALRGLFVGAPSGAMISVTLPGASRLKALLQWSGNAGPAIEIRAVLRSLFVGAPSGAMISVTCRRASRLKALLQWSETHRDRRPPVPGWPNPALAHQSTRQNTDFRYRLSGTCASHGWSAPAPLTLSTCAVRPA